MGFRKHDEEVPEQDLVEGEYSFGRVLVILLQLFVELMELALCRRILLVRRVILSLLVYPDLRVVTSCHGLRCLFPCFDTHYPFIINTYEPQLST